MYIAGYHTRPTLCAGRKEKTLPLAFIKMCVEENLHKQAMSVPSIYVAIIHCITAFNLLGHPCVVSLLCYIVATFTVCLVKCEDNGERILYVDGQERTLSKLVS